jgi:hypothetical protein
MPAADRSRTRWCQRRCRRAAIRRSRPPAGVLHAVREQQARPAVAGAGRQHAHRLLDAIADGGRAARYQAADLPGVGCRPHQLVLLGGVDRTRNLIDRVARRRAERHHAQPVTGVEPDELHEERRGVTRQPRSAPQTRPTRMTATITESGQSAKTDPLRKSRYPKGQWRAITTPRRLPVVPAVGPRSQHGSGVRLGRCAAFRSRDGGSGRTVVVATANRWPEGNSGYSMPKLLIFCG